MQKSTSQKIKLGIFVILGTVLLVSALYFIGNRQNLFGKSIKLHAQFANVNGLQLGNNVRYSGINAGTVIGIEMTGQSQIVVSMLISEKIGGRIQKNAIATIGSDGLVGSMIVNIIPRKGEFPSVISGDTIATYSKIGADDMLTTLNVTNENAAILTSELLEITNKVLEGKGTVGMLINDSIMADDLKQSVFQLKQASTSASKAMAELNGIISSVNYEESVAGLLLSDTASAQKMRTVVDNLEQSSVNIEAMTRSLGTYISEIKEGKGTLNYLTQDEKFVKDLDSTLTNIKEATYRLNENMEALKHNFFFRGYFRKLERQNKKN
ncbi:MAG: MlaD family protein [Altibacter sp.]|uniref:MlaD family protein n=1 Tax=Altibacter sp. TaxID=2024823 RepID=UPI001D6D8FE9|nr:MlaD family protein [Altibacter sp.]MBZ0327264.1 MlaD family protein [Altibacter sp.]